MDFRQWPDIPTALMDHLERAFPERSPRKGEALDDLRFRGGQRDVVLTIRAVFDQQNETVLNVHQHEPIGGSSGDDG